MIMHENGTSMCTLADGVAVCNYAFEVRSGQTLYLIIPASQIKNKLVYLQTSAHPSEPPVDLHKRDILKQSFIFMILLLFISELLRIRIWRSKFIKRLH